jgi:putative SOS response-associated peptidase YedK
MCGRYSFIHSPKETQLLFQFLEEPDFPPRHNVSPSEPIAIVRMDQRERHFALVRWGLVPSWVKDFKSFKPLINARAETVLQKASFRNAMKRRRCLIPASGFYEWKGDVPGKKQAFHIHRPDHGLFAFAGLWEHWLGSDGSEIETAAIITTDANQVVAEIHNRMPVVIMPEDFAAWLNISETETTTAAKLLRPAPDDYFVAEPTIITRNSPPPRPRPAVQEGQPKLL